LLELQLKTTTGATKAQTEAVDKNLEALSDQSGVLVTNIRPAFSVLVRATHDTTKALQLQKIAMDVSAGTGKGLTAVTQAMSRAAAGNSNALNRLVPGIKDAKDKMAFLEKTFKGAAKTAADKDPYARLQVVMDNLKGTLGKAVLPVLQAFVPILKAVLPVVATLGKLLGSLVNAVMPFITALIKALMPALNAIVRVVMIVVKQAMKPLQEILHLLTPIINKVAQYFTKIWTALGPLIGQLVKALFPILMVIVKALVQLLNSALMPFLDIMMKVWMPVIKIASTLISKFLLPAVEKIADALGNVLQPVVDAVGKAFQQLGKLLMPVWDNVLKPMFDGLMAMLGIKVEPTIAPKVDESGMDIPG